MRLLDAILCASNNSRSRRSLKALERRQRLRYCPALYRHTSDKQSGLKMTPVQAALGQDHGPKGTEQLQRVTRS